jgi:hypothetical protein
MHRIVRSISAALALALVTAASAQAGPVQGRAAPETPAVLETLQGWLASLWTTPAAGLSRIWEEEGSIMDPDGRPTGTPQVPGQDAGSIMDPDG